MKHKTQWYLAAAAVCWLLFAGCSALDRAREPAGNGPAAVYEGTAQGYRGPIRVQVHMEGDRITEIVIVDSSEDYSVGAAAMEELLDLVLLYNTTDLDAISGATESSVGFLNAVENAILSP